MSLSFEENDIVWCQHPTSKFWPAKIVLDEVSGQWKKEDEIFAQFFHVGQGRRAKGKWHKVDEVIPFEVGADEPEFENETFIKVYNLAKSESAKNISQKHASIKIKRCKPPTKAVQTPKTTKKRGRPSKSASKATKAAEIKSEDIKTEARIVVEKMTMDFVKKQLNVTVCDEDMERLQSENEDEDLDEETKARVAEDNKAFLDDLDSDEDDDDEDKENDGDWNPNKENMKPKFVFKNSSKRTPFTPLVLMKEEKSEYELIQERNKAEQRKMLEALMASSSELSRSFRGPKVPRKYTGASAKVPAHRRRESAPVRYSTRQQPPRTRSRRDSTGESFSSGLSTPTKRLFEEDCDHDDYMAAKRSRDTMRSHPTRWIKNPNTDFLPADDITEDMLGNVSDFVSEKIYNQVLILNKFSLRGHSNYS